ncbi:MAG: carbonic anhydrase [Bacteroidota bacterium]
MENLIRGIVEFRKTDFETHQELFRKISDSQYPHTLFIGCSDSRVVPNLITKTLPGEIFVIRNVANIVPVYQAEGDYLGITSAIEYAVQSLGVDNILVCGHSNCGGCAALFKTDDELSHLPHTRNWLKLSKTVREKVLNLLPGENSAAAREWMAEQINVVEQLRHLLTYPYIEKRYREGSLELIGWHYIIETGEVFGYNEEKGFFELIN